MNNQATSRFLANAIGLETTTDKILFGIAVFLTVILIVVLSLFCKKRNQVVPQINNEGPIDKILHEKNKKAKSSSKYPSITITQKERTNSQGSIQSEVSSMWDTQSQKYDQKHFKDTELRLEIDKCLTAGSRDIESGGDENDSTSDSTIDEISSCTSDFGSTIERGDEAMVPRTNVNVEDETMLAISMHKIQTEPVSKSQDFEYIDSRDDYYDSGRRGSI